MNYEEASTSSAYMRGIIDHLALNIGERFCGTENEHRAARYIADEATKAGLSVDLQRVPFVGWRLEQNPVLTLQDGTGVPASAMMYSGGTGDGPVSGRLRKSGTKSIIAGLYDWPLFEIIDDASNVLAQIAVADTTQSISVLSPNPRYRIPAVVVGRQSLEVLEAAVAGGQGAELSLNASVVPDAECFNVIARYVGDPSSHDETMVIAHYDTQLNTPGAYDNASGVASQLWIAQQVVKSQAKVNLLFVWVAGEEVGLVGSEYLARSMEENDQLKNLKACVCIDQISAGDELWLWADDSSKEVALATAERGNLSEFGPIRMSDPMPGCDMWPFAAREVPSILYMWWRLSDYHSPGDIPELVEDDKLLATTRAILESLVA